MIDRHSNYLPFLKILFNDFRQREREIERELGGGGVRQKEKQNPR